MANPPEVGWHSWHADPAILVGALVLTGWYAWSARRLDAIGEGPSTRQRVAFAAAVVIVLLALASPLHDLSDYYLFTAHMAQHLLLTLVMPPLFIYSLAPRMVRLGALLPVARFLTQPLMAFALCNVIFGVWHLPLLYDTTLRNHDLHVFSHLLFMSTSVILWWPVMSRVPELPALSQPAQLLYLFAQVLPGSLIGGLIANTTRPLYGFYASAPRIVELTLTQDHQLGAIVMWVGGGTFWLAAFTVVFFKWAARDMAETRRARA